MSDLPAPDSPELRNLVTGSARRAIYRLLYANRGRPLTMQQIRDQLGDSFGSQEQLDRRRRELNPLFDFRKTKLGKHTAYELVALRADAREQRPGINQKLRAQVLQPQRCAMCGRTPLEDHVKLVVDHKIPQEWGGDNDPDNLQPLCEDCNGGKRNFFETFDAFASRIRQAIGHDEPHRRIGELLKAFEGEWVPSDLIGIVASARQYQEDWQKRLRELRTLDWIIEAHKRHDEGPRVRTYYRVVQWHPWPNVPIRRAIAARERVRRISSRPGSDDRPIEL